MVILRANNIVRLIRSHMMHSRQQSLRWIALEDTYIYFVDTEMAQVDETRIRSPNTVTMSLTTSFSWHVLFLYDCGTFCFMTKLKQHTSLIILYYVILVFRHQISLLIHKGQLQYRASNTARNSNLAKPRLHITYFSRQIVLKFCVNDGTKFQSNK